MELLQRVFAALQDIVVVLGKIVAGIAGAFNVILDTTTAQLIGIMILIAFAIRLLLWPVGNASSFKPQTIVLTTSKTPWQVVWGDIKGCLTAVFWMIVILGGLFLLSRAGF